jgi:hypothetical protein
MTQIEVVRDGLYKITVEVDGEITWAKYFEYALDAAETFMKFTDSGDARYERIVTLDSPDGSRRTKVFTVGYVTVKQ